MFQLAVGGVGAVFSSFKQSCLTYVDANIFFSIFFSQFCTTSWTLRKLYSKTVSVH